MGGTDLKSVSLVFNWIEYGVFGSMLLMSLLIGVYYGWFKTQNTVAEYMLGGKHMSIFPITMSLVFSHVSGVTILGIPAETYSYGTQYCLVIVSSIIVLFLVCHIYLPVFYHLQLNSLYEYLELRFDKSTRTLASLIFGISLIIYIPVVLYGPALAFNQVSGFSLHVFAPIISLICIFYTSFGGLKAVVWSDALQGAFTLGAMIFITILGIKEIGGISEVWRINEEGGRIEVFVMDPNPFVRNTFWTMVLGQIFIWLANIAVHPGASQRFIAVQTYEEARAVMFWSTFGFFVVKILALGVGLIIYATFYDCDPVATKIVSKTGQLVPHYVMGIAKDYPGLSGLFISGVISGALSTMSAGLNTVAGTIYEDFIQFVLKGKKQTDTQHNLTIKFMVLFIGMLCAALVYVVANLGDLFQMAVSLVGITNGTLVGVFTLGLLFPRANAKGAMAGVISGLLGVGTLVIGAQYFTVKKLLKFPGKMTRVDGCPANFTASLGFNASARTDTYVGLSSPVIADPSVPLVFKVSYLYYGMIGTFIVIGVGLIVSYLTEEPPSHCLDQRLFPPCIRRFLPQKELSKPSPEEYTLVSTKDDGTKINNIVKTSEESLTNNIVKNIEDDILKNIDDDIVNNTVGNDEKSDHKKEEGILIKEKLNNADVSS